MGTRGVPGSGKGVAGTVEKDEGCAGTCTGGDPCSDWQLLRSADRLRVQPGTPQHPTPLPEGTGIPEAERQPPGTAPIPAEAWTSEARVPRSQPGPGPWRPAGPCSPLHGDSSSEIVARSP